MIGACADVALAVAELEKRGAGWPTRTRALMQEGPKGYTPPA